MDREQLIRRFELTDRVVVVTGGTRGIGLALAEGYVAAGAKVVIASRKADACAEAQRHLEALGGDALGVPTHLGDLDALNALVAATVDRYGRLDVLVNNAANALTQPVGQFTVDAYTKSFDVNVRGPVFLSQAALPHLIASGHGSILNIVSAGAYLFSGDVSMYSAGKAAMVSFTKSFAAALAPQGVRVNAMAPGPVDTDMVRNNPPEFVDILARSTLLGRVADPDEMVGTALLLTSDAGSYLTGQVIGVDGGLVPR
jgi:NAD(P)-dependent dehydrogenase (short-subunit alcohol dehydrogenase family)